MQTPLPMNEPITDVLAVKALSPNHPVFLLTVNGMKYTVVKSETSVAAAKDLSHNLAVMKRVDTALKAKVLDASEHQAVKGFADNEVRLSQTLAWKGPPSEDVTRLKTMMISPVGSIFRMERYQGIVDLGMAMKEADSKTTSRQIASALNAPGGFEMLGKIVAADLYNHNTDRFDFDCVVLNGRVGMLNDRTGNRFKIIANAGNVMMAVTNKVLKPIGLDSYDSNSIYRELGVPLSKIERDSVGGGGGAWWGRLLRDDAKDSRKTAAKYILEDIESALTPRDRKLSILSSKRLDSSGERRLLNGLDEARAALIEKARAKHRSIRPSDPIGIADRCQVLLGLK